MKKISKLLLLVSSFGLIASSTLLCSCSSSNSGNPSIPEDNVSVKFRLNNLDLTIGESAILGVSIRGGTVDTKLSFSVEDEKIATVTNEGLLTALEFGQTVVKATYGKAIATCRVNVLVKDNIPVIALDNIEEKSVMIDVSTHLELQPSIIFNNTSYKFEPSYTLSNSDVGEMLGNTFIPKANGTEYITVKGKFHGLQAISTTLEVVVQDNVIIYMKDENEIEQNEVILYSDEGYGEEVFKTSFTPSFGVCINDKEVVSPTINIELLNADNVVTYNPVTYEVKSTSKVGTASYQIKFTDDDGNEFFKLFDIYNNKSVFEYKGAIIETDSINGVLPLEDIFSRFADKDIDMITNLDGSISYEIEGGIVKNLPVLIDSLGNVNTQQFIVYNKTVGYKVTLRVFTKIFKEAKDFDYFNLATLNENFSGYYVLDNDIDGSGYELKAHKRTMGKSYLEYPNVGLTGTFDGRGHTIKNLSIGEGGIFGNLGKGGTIKNIGFKDIDIREHSKAGGDDTPIIASYINGAIFENVYISNPYIRAGYNAGLVACNIMNNCLFANCMFECFMDNQSDIVTKNFGILGSMCGEKNSLPKGFGNVYKNVVINSNLPLIKSTTNVSSGSNPYVIDTFSIELAGHESYILQSGIIRFTDKDEMATSGQTFDTFSTDYWAVESNVLKWKSAM